MKQSRRDSSSLPPSDRINATQRPERDESRSYIPRYPDWCSPLAFRTRDEHHQSGVGTVALASFPGSGNTWIRYLLQQCTGILTGTIYVEDSHLIYGFVDSPVADDSVLVVKTHQLPSDVYDKAILVARDPFGALVAEWNRMAGGPLGYAPDSSYTNARGEVWTRYVYEKIKAWRNFNMAWYHRFHRNINPKLHVMSYNQLLANTTVELTTLLTFLNIVPSKEHLKCCMSRQKGLFWREKRVPNITLFDATMNKTISRIKHEVFETLGL